MRARAVLLVTMGGLACASSRPAPPATATPAPSVAPTVNALAEGEAALARAQWARADSLLAEAERREPSPRTAALRARAVLEQARFEDALALARRSIARSETYEARFVEGRVLAIRRELEGSARSYERCIALEAGRPEAWSALAALRLAVGDQPGAEQAFAELARRVPRLQAEDLVWTDIQRAPPDPFQLQEGLDRCSRGTAAYLAGNYPEARHEMLSVMGLMPGFAHCWSELGKVSWKMGRPEDAEAAFRRALQGYRPDQPGLRADTEALLAALIVERGGDAAEAVRLARASVGVRGERAATVETLARACEAAKDRACARQSYGKLVEAAAAPEPTRLRAKERLEALRN